MAKELVVKDPHDINTIVDLIHDCWFKKDAIVFDPETAVLRFKFNREASDKKTVVGRFLFLRKVQIPLFECFLVINHVIDFVMNDPAKIDEYDFNELKYDERLRCITITGGVPIVIEIRVTDFHLSVEETDNVTGLKERLALS